MAELGAVRLSGFLGWLMWLGVHLVNVISFRSRIFVLVNWAWDYFFYDRPIRLILRAREGGIPGPSSDAHRGEVPPHEDRASQTGRTRG